MNYGELKNYVASTLHRADLVTAMPQFVRDAQDRIGRRFGIELAPLVADDDTDAVLTASPLLYQYATLREACAYLRDFEGVNSWGGLYDIEASIEVVTSRREATDPDTVDGEPPVIKRGKK